MHQLISYQYSPVVYIVVLKDGMQDIASLSHNKILW